VAEPFTAEAFGIPVAADIAIGAAELATDLIRTNATRARPYARDIQRHLCGASATDRLSK